MEFKIERTSDFTNRKQPCQNAYLTDEKDDLGCNIYKIKIESLEDFIALMNEVHETILLKEDMSIEIYDDWRE